MHTWKASLIVAISLSIMPAHAESNSNDVQVEVVGEPETVFNYQKDRCGPLQLPDSPARAFRRADGSVALLAAHYVNGPLVGESFDTLRPDCTALFRGSEMSAPSEYNDRGWIQGLLPLPDGRVLSLISNEYRGIRHPEGCNDGAKRPLCWYSSITAAVADEESFKFELLPLPSRVIASATQPYSSQINRAGFFTTSNVVRSGNYYYFASWTETEATGKGTGNCLFRAPINDPVDGWKALRNGTFDGDFPSPYANPTQSGVKCDRIGGASLGSALRSVVRLDGSNIWLGISASRNDPPGLYLTTSDDLINWTAPQLFRNLPSPIGNKVCDAFYLYPSLIDHKSTSQLFDTAGKDAYLYLTRLNFQNCKRGLDRDLVRYKVKVKYYDKRQRSLQ
jgi:hypothetical protein